MSDYFIFDNIDTRNYDDILVYFNEIDTTPKRVGEFIEIPNRNGSFFLDGGRYEDVTHTYDIVALSKEDASDLINALASKVGYFRLQDSFNTDEFYSAVFNSEIEPKITKERDKLTFKVTFTCKPQRWLTMGEELVDVGEWINWETESGPIVEIEATETDAVKSLVADIDPIQDLHGYDKPWVGGSGDNKYPNSAISGTVKGVTVTQSGSDYILSGTASAYAQILSTETFVLKAGSYVLKEFNWARGVALQLRSTDGQTVYASLLNAESVTFTLSEDTECKARIVVMADTVTDMTIKAMVVSGSTAPTAYSPYENICPISGRTSVDTIVSPTTSASDGQTYTTALGRTVYGGTLDVVSGVLTVTHAMVDLGTLAWEYNSNVPWFYSWTDASSRKPNPSSEVANIWSSDYKAYSRDVLISTDIAGICIDTSGNVVIRDSRYTDATAFKTAMSGVQLCYELATPQTYQLTPQQIDLLLGTNNIWADTGDVTLEYGQNPNVIINPTLFESSPLLEVDGGGTISFNGYNIELENGPYGDIQIIEQERDFPRRYQSYIFNSSIANIGDQIKIDLLSVDTIIPSRHSVTFVREDITGSGFNYSYSIGADGLSTHTEMTDVVLTVGTAITLTYRLVVRQAPDYSTAGSISVEYDGNDTITIYVGEGLSYKTSFTNYHSACILTSTKLILEGTIYIDCDLGEAYKIEDGQIVSLNAYINLGSDLPTLAVGDTEFTFDNTITDLQVVPRWWKI